MSRTTANNSSDSERFPNSPNPIKYTPEEKMAFMFFVESLKLVRKATLEDATTGESIIENIYTDILPNNGVINKLNLPNTTIVNGRKGTGKSTIFQKSINEVIGRDDVLCIYIDVKSLVDNTPLPISYQAEGAVLPNDEIKKYLTYVEFLKIIIAETKRKIQDKLSTVTLFNKLFRNDEAKFDLVTDKLNEIEKNSEEVFRRIDTTLFSYVNEFRENNVNSHLNSEIVLKAHPSIKMGGEYSKESSIKKEFQSTISTFLDIKNTLINNLIKIKNELCLKYIYIYLDDFSEIDKEGQEFFINWFVTPLNNNSENFIKFKIATYPHRFYEGKLDPGKYDQINLDFFEAYSSYESKEINVSQIETYALDYTKRLLNNRFRHYFKNIEWQKFFALSELKLVEVLFEVSLNVTRKIGFILSYCYETHVANDMPITKEAIKKASERYFNEVVEKFFKANTYVIRPFNDKISIENYNGLLKEIIKTLSGNYNPKASKRNYFVVNEEFCYLLDILNLNGYISTYNQIKNKNQHNLTVYCLDYGLCIRNEIPYAKPDLSTSKAIKNSSVDALILKYFNNTQAIKCPAGHEFEYNQIEKFKGYGMKCPLCLDENIITICQIISIDKELLLRLKQIEEKSKLLISFTEYTVMEHLASKSNALTVMNISENIDRSQRTVQRVIEQLYNKRLVDIDKAASDHLGKTFYALTGSGSTLIRHYLKLNEENVVQQSSKSKKGS